MYFVTAKIKADFFHGHFSSSYGLMSSCNNGCACSDTNYKPVCGEGVTYYSPCHAGCNMDFKNGVSLTVTVPTFELDDMSVWKVMLHRQGGWKRLLEPL